MSSNTQSTNNQNRTRGGNRGRGSGGGNGGNNNGNSGNSGNSRGKGRRGGGGQTNRAAPKSSSDPERTSAAHNLTSGAVNDNEDAEDCFICANPIKYYALSPCNHSTCHVCNLRMRALYEEKNCAHCRTPSDFVILATNLDKKYEDYTDSQITGVDADIGVRYSSEVMVADTTVLLQYNCPDPTCDYTGLGIADLHRHTKSVHHKRMCDLCTRNKRVFTHEHTLYDTKELETHMKHGDDKMSTEQSGFKGHPICGFCNERFYDADQLFLHCRNKHERCFICDRDTPTTPTYFEHYDALEEHFKKMHFPCMNRECLETKFVVFGSEVDLKAHQLEKHAASLSKEVRRNLQTVNLASFQVHAPYQPESDNRGGRARRGGRNPQGRDPDAETVPIQATHHMRRDEIAFHRQQALANGHQPPSQSATSNGRSAQDGPSAGQSNSASDASLANMTPEERARVTRHQHVIERASAFCGNDAETLAEFRRLVSSYNTHDIGATEMLNSMFNLFDQTPPSSVATLVRELNELYEEPRTKQHLRMALEAWRATHENYPALPDSANGGSSRAPGWATTRKPEPSRKGKQVSDARGPAPVTAKVPTTWGAPSSSARASANDFPALPAKGKAPAPAPTRTMAIRSVPPVAGGADSFPSLPPAPKVQTTIFAPGGRGNAVRRDFGVVRDTGFSWTGTAGSSSQSAGANGASAEPEEGDGKKKKGKKAFKKLVL